MKLYTPHLYGDYKKPLWGSLKQPGFNGKLEGFVFSCLKWKVFLVGPPTKLREPGILGNPPVYFSGAIYEHGKRSVIWYGYLG